MKNHIHEMQFVESGDIKCAWLDCYFQYSAREIVGMMNCIANGGPNQIEMITKKMLETMTAQHGGMASLRIFGDGSGHILDDDDAVVFAFDTLEELKAHLESSKFANLKG